MARHAELAEVLASQPSTLIRYARIDGLPGFVTLEGGGVVQTTALLIEGQKTGALYVQCNPDRPRGIVIAGQGEGSPFGERTS